MSEVGQKKCSSVLAMNTFVKLMRCTEKVRYRVHKHLVKIGITESQLAVMEVIYHKGAMNQQLIGKKILKSKSNLTTVLENLEKNGLINREQSIEDKRHQIVSLTKQGEDLISIVFPNHVNAISDAFSVLSSEEQILLGNLCKKLGMSI